MLSHKACGRLLQHAASASRCSDWNRFVAARFAASSPKTAEQFAPYSGKALFLGVGMAGAFAVGGTAVYDYFFAKQYGDLQQTITSSFDEWDDQWDYKDGEPPAEAMLILERIRKYREDEQTEDFGMRRLILVRDGQTDGTALTAQGREQATLTGKHLQAMLGKTARVVYASKQASETAKLLQPHLGNCDVVQLPSLQEGIPAMPSPRPPEFTKDHEDAIETDGPRIQSAFSCLFCRPTGTQLDKSAVEVLVCSGNILRFFITRALQLPISSWLRFKCEHCGIVVIDINFQGQVFLCEFGSVGHIPRHLRSY